MQPIWRIRAITGAALFLETCSLYLVFAVVSNLARVDQLHMPLWLVLVGLTWAFLLSSWVLSQPVTPVLRGLIGLALGIPSLLVLTAWNVGRLFSPIDLLVGGTASDVGLVVGSIMFLLIVWWRGVELQREDVTLDAVRSGFQMGMVVLLVASLIDAVTSGRIVSGFLVVGFFAVGLFAMAMARFSAESTEERAMPSYWVWPIIACVAVVLGLGLLISGLGLGGLDDVTRAIVDVVGAVGYRILEPVLMVIGLLAGALVSVGNWFSGILGGGDLEGLIDAQRSIEEFHESLRNTESTSTGNALFTALKWIATAIGSCLVLLIVYKLFRIRRHGGRNPDVTESRESLFNIKRAGEDIGEALGGLFGGIGGRRRGRAIFRSPRDYYHAFLEQAERAGRRKEEWETPREHQRGLSGVLPADPVAHIVDEFQVSHYGGGQSDQGQMDRLEADRLALEQFIKDNPQKP